MWHILVEFVLSASFGLAAGMLVTSPRLVVSSFFRVHLWLLLGLAAFAGGTLILWAGDTPVRVEVVYVVIAAGIVSYLGAVSWLYERARWGQLFLALAALLFLWGAFRMAGVSSRSVVAVELRLLDVATAGLVVGLTLAAMLLGHWYLRTPGMQLTPLVRLLKTTGLAVVARLTLCAGGWAAWLHAGGTLADVELAAATLRWLVGIFGVFVLVILAWRTLKIPNTQSATGILYVAVVFALLGELASQLLSVRIPYPV